jgi:hypothetical protein
MRQNRSSKLQKGCPHSKVTLTFLLLPSLAPPYTHSSAQDHPHAHHHDGSSHQHAQQDFGAQQGRYRLHQSVDVLGGGKLLLHLGGCMRWKANERRADRSLENVTEVHERLRRTSKNASHSLIHSHTHIHTLSSFLPCYCCRTHRHSILVDLLRRLEQDGRLLRDHRREVHPRKVDLEQHQPLSHLLSVQQDLGLGSRGGG